VRFKTAIKKINRPTALPAVAYDHGPPPRRVRPFFRQNSWSRRPTYTSVAHQSRWTVWDRPPLPPLSLRQCKIETVTKK